MLVEDILFLNSDDVKKAQGGNMELAIKTMETVFSLHEKDDYVLPSKSALRWGDLDSESTLGRINSMPASIGGNINSVGIKWIASAPNNPDKYNLPRANGVIILNDYETLLPIAIMDCKLISATRTAANSGVAAKHLANKDAAVLGLIGAGAQNRTQLLAMKQTLAHLKKVKITDLNTDRAKQFADEMSKIIDIPIEVVDSAESAVRDSDVFITATVTKKPIVQYDWIKKGALYIHVGSHECEFEVIDKADKIVVDDWEQLKHRGVETISIMYEEGKFDENTIHAQLGEIVNNKKTGREESNEFIYFNSVGLGIQDVALAHEVYKNAVNNNIGTKGLL